MGFDRQFNASCDCPASSVYEHWHEGIGACDGEEGPLAYKYELIAQMEDFGWRIKGNTTICGNCWEAMEANDE